MKIGHFWTAFKLFYIFYETLRDMPLYIVYIDGILHMYTYCKTDKIMVAGFWQRIRSAG